MTLVKRQHVKGPEVDTIAINTLILCTVLVDVFETGRSEGRTKR